MRKPLVRERAEKNVFDVADLGAPALIRVKHHPERKLGGKGGVKSARYVLRRGCCKEKLKICYDESSLEINGVSGSIANWSAILLPLLGINPKDATTKERRWLRVERELVRLRKKYAHPGAR
jgi:hypothetical protein